MRAGRNNILCSESRSIAKIERNTAVNRVDTMLLQSQNDFFDEFIPEFKVFQDQVWVSKTLLLLSVIRNNYVVLELIR